MTVAFKFKICLSNLYRLVKILIRERSHDRTHLFFTDRVIWSKLAVRFNYDDAGVFWNGDTGFLRYGEDRLTNNITSGVSVFKDSVDNLFSFFAVCDKSSAFSESV